MVTEAIREVIFIGLPGPTHNYGGLSTDNVASNLNRGSVSNPRQAALQALELVRLLRSRGVEVALLPPQLRPHLPTLRQHFSGDVEELITQAAQKNPALLERVSSSSAMWAANAATSSPAIDNADERLHLTVANLHTNLHRRIEAEDTYRLLTAIFAKVPRAVVHAPLDGGQGLRDEGAANHMRLLPQHGGRALHVFVYGTDGSPGDPLTARQTLSASQAVAWQHGIADDAALFIKQNPAVIKEGVFHNDVIAVSNESVLLAHEHAYEAGQGDIGRIADAYRLLHGKKLTVITVTNRELGVDEAVHTYFFNSQIVTRPDGGMTLIAPTETQALYAGKAARLLNSICADNTNPIDEVKFIDLRQSMNNGGGPACLRLRVPMAQHRLEAIRASVRVIADEKLLSHLEQMIHTHYPETLSPAEIADPALYFRCRTVLMELSALMNLPLLAE